MHRLVVIDLACGPHQPRGGRRARDQKPRIDRNTVPTHARARLEDVYPRVAVGEADHLPYIHLKYIGDHRQLVGKGDVDVAERVFDQLYGLCHAGCGVETVTFHKACVEHRRAFCAGRGDAADNPVIMHQFVDDPARQHPLRAIGERDVRLFYPAVFRYDEIGAQLSNNRGHPLGGAHRRSALDDHASTRQNLGCDGAGGGLDKGYVGRLAIPKRGRHRDHVEACGRYLCRGDQRLSGDGVVYQPVEIALFDVHATGIDRVDHLLRDIDTADAPTIRRKQSRGRQADIAQSDHRYLMVWCWMRYSLAPERGGGIERCVHAVKVPVFRHGSWPQSP